MVGPSKQTTKQAYTHMRNEVTLVRGLLRLTPINLYIYYYLSNWIPFPRI